MKIRFLNYETKEIILEHEIEHEIEMPTPHSFVKLNDEEHVAVSLLRSYEKEEDSFLGKFGLKTESHDVTVLEVLVANEEQYTRLNLGRRSQGPEE